MPQTMRRYATTTLVNRPSGLLPKLLDKYKVNYNIAIAINDYASEQKIVGKLLVRVILIWFGCNVND